MFGFGDLLSPCNFIHEQCTWISAVVYIMVCRWAELESAAVCRCTGRCWSSDLLLCCCFFDSGRDRRTKSYAGIVTAWNDYRSWRDTQQAVCRSLPLEGNQQAQGLNDSLESNIDLCENQSCESRAQKVKNRGYFVIWWLFRRFRWTQQFVVWRTSCDVSSRKAPSALLSLVLLSNHKLVAFLQFYVVYVRRWRKETHTSRNSKTFTG